MLLPVCSWEMSVALIGSFYFLELFLQILYIFETLLAAFICYFLPSHMSSPIIFPFVVLVLSLNNLFAFIFALYSLSSGGSKYILLWVHARECFGFMFSPEVLWLSSISILNPLCFIFVWRPEEGNAENPTPSNSAWYSMMRRACGTQRVWGNPPAKALLSENPQDGWFRGLPLMGAAECNID